MEGTKLTRRVMIVDDDRIVRRVLGRMLAAEGWAVDEVDSSTAALAQIVERAPDVLLTDLRMPGMDGVQLVEALRTRAPGLPVVVMTASGEIASSVRAMRAGAADYLTKPIELPALLLALDRAIERARLDSEVVGLRFQREITAALASAELDGPAILRALARRTAEAIGDLCSIRLLSPDGTQLLPGAFYHRQPDALALIASAFTRSQPSSLGLAEQVFRGGAPVLLARASDHIRRAFVAAGLSEYVDRHGVTSVLAAPLVARGKPIGLLTCIRGWDSLPYGERDLTLVRDLSERASIAVENARLYAEVKERVSQLESARASLRKTEEQLDQSRRIESLGRLAAGVAHDFNNVLSVVMGNADLMLEEEVLSDDARARLAAILKASRHAASLTGQLLAFGRRQHLEPRLVDLNVILQGTVEMIRSMVGQHIEVELRLAPDAGRVRVDPGKLEQVLMNLASNARDAMPRGGRLTISTANEPLPETPGEAPVSGATFTAISVSDTGEGFDAATAGRIFEPFYTTKPAGKGTGLGLPMVLGIVQQSGGHVRVESSPGRGATFKVYLPHSAESSRRSTSRPDIPTHGGKEIVLLVDDEDDVRAVVRRQLERAGYQVLAASGPAEAAAVSASVPPASISLLLTDIVMPGASGLEVAHDLRLERPELRVIYMSAYAPDAFRDLGEVPDGAEFLQKPIARDRLLATVRAVLDGGVPAQAR